MNVQRAAVNAILFNASACLFAVWSTSTIAGDVRGIVKAEAEATIASELLARVSHVPVKAGELDRIGSRVAEREVRQFFEGRLGRLPPLFVVLPHLLDDLRMGRRNVVLLGWVRLNVV